MSKAREIVEERFARGEISEEEFKSIVGKLAASASGNRRPIDRELPFEQGRYLSTPSSLPISSKLPQSYQKDTEGMSVGLILGLVVSCVFIVLGAIVYFAYEATAGGLETANLLNHGHKVTFDISNTGSKTGDVLVYAEESSGGGPRCIHLFEMRPGTVTNINVPCEIGTGKEVIVHTRWADSGVDEGLVPLAKRLKIDW
jgi:hypothetical protein